MAAVVAERAGPDPPERVEAEIEARLRWAAEAAVAAAPGRSAGRAAADADSWDWDEEEEEAEHVNEGRALELGKGQDARQALPGHAGPIVDAVATVTFGADVAARAHGSLPKDESQQPQLRPPLPPAPHVAIAGPDGGGLRDVSALERRRVLLQRLGFPLCLGSGSGGAGSGGEGGASAIALAYAHALRDAIASADVEAVSARRRQQQEQAGWLVAAGGGGGGTWRRCATLTCMCASATARLRAQGCRCCAGDGAELPAPPAAAAADELARSPPPRVATLSGLMWTARAATDRAGASAAEGAAGQGKAGATAGAQELRGAGAGPGAQSDGPGPVPALPADGLQAPQPALRSPLRPIQPMTAPGAGVSKQGEKQQQPQGQGKAQRPAGDKAAPLPGGRPADQAGSAAQATCAPARSRAAPPGAAVPPRASCLLSLILQADSPLSADPPSPRSPPHRRGHGRGYHVHQQHGAGGRAGPGAAPRPQRPCDVAAGVTPPPHASPRMGASSGGGSGSGGEASAGQRASGRRRLSGFIGLFTTPDSPEPGSEHQRGWRQSPARALLDLPSPGDCGPEQQPTPQRRQACGWDLCAQGPGSAEDLRDASAVADQEQVPPCSKRDWAATAMETATGDCSGLIAPLRSEQHGGRCSSDMRGGKRPRLPPVTAAGSGVAAGAAAANPTASFYLAGLLASSSDEDE